MKKSILLTLVFFIAINLNAQEYNEINANQIRTGMHSNGSLFFDRNFQNAGFWVPYDGIGSPAALFAGGVWVAGVDPVGNLKTGNIEYGGIGSNPSYTPGPANAADIPVDFDKVWKVNLEEIKELQADFADGSVDDTPSTQLLEWPGSGNPHYGGDLPVQRLAPFTDVNQDAIYNPYDGDYPSIDLPSGTTTPSEMLYTVFYDGDSGSNSPTEVEIHSIMYAFSSEDDPIIDNTVFTRFVMINQSPIPLNDFVFSYWIDPDLGCYEDDYIGCDPDRDAMFVYNSDPVDGDASGGCQGGITTYEGTPPVLTLTFLNQDMSSFMIYFNGGVGSPQSATTDPGIPFEYFSLMNGNWKDGTPLTTGGTGYNPGSTEETLFAYPGLPTDPSGWNMVNTALPFADHRTLSSISASSFQPGEILTVDAALSASSQEMSNHLDVVEIALEDSDYIKEAYGISGLSKVEYLEADNHVYMSPNPNNGTFTIEGGAAYDRFLITDILGNEVQAGHIDASSLSLRLTPNVYFMHLSGTDTKHIRTLRFVIVE